jgi:ATP-dependent 26S proteasome regulatory subunit
VRQVFDRARQMTPCFLVLEDLDSLVNAQNRSFFLNELDGFATNIGIVVLATTNHPEKLDPAILDRPSRFDRKYHFNLPETAERAAYLELWNAGLEPELKLTGRGIINAAELTDTFSFAYLKELMLSSVMAWMDKDDHSKSMDLVLLEQAALLRDQMAYMVAETPSVEANLGNEEEELE